MIANAWYYIIIVRLQWKSCLHSVFDFGCKSCLFSLPLALILSRTYYSLAYASTWIDLSQFESRLYCLLDQSESTGSIQMTSVTHCKT